eukprot:1783079-Pleurochrysis_carterae.AAC.2
MKLATACVHEKHGGRAAPWCKIPVVAHVLQNGIHARRCASVMYLDSDAYFDDATVSIDEYFARARRLGDDAVNELGANWHLLFSSNAPFQPDGLCTAVFWVRNTQQAGADKCLHSSHPFVESCGHVLILELMPVHVVRALSVSAVSSQSTESPHAMRPSSRAAIIECIVRTLHVRHPVPHMLSRSLPLARRRAP